MNDCARTGRGGVIPPPLTLSKKTISNNSFYDYSHFYSARI
ncbi:Hypothetical protein ETEE_3324 [Edwardsiella anguillarum ET080813]|uniref:Uncharacterized protein n=1 Tax=Edwardsiella anguillarum ET080813 TaxID=667120 RepID=A0A076LPE0_9GAMM|nr:Hypothetical protein ETEE_3324 [Edwardsiella anguillarum ET080813]